MQCLRCLCVQCRDPMNLVNTRNGVSVPDGTGKLITLHSECFVAWLNGFVRATWPDKLRPSSSKRHHDHSLDIGSLDHLLAGWVLMEKEIR